MHRCQREVLEDHEPQEKFRLAGADLQRYNDGHTLQVLQRKPLSVALMNPLWPVWEFSFATPKNLVDEMGPSFEVLHGYALKLAHITVSG